MAMIKFEDEKDLQRNICSILNKHGYNFKKEKDGFFCDIVDYTIKAFGEIKTNGKFAPHQLLYGLAKEEIKDAQYLILANEFELRVYTCPEIDKIMDFARKISPDLSRMPSSITELKYLDEGFKIMGTHLSIYTYNSKFTVDESTSLLVISKSNPPMEA